jgi:hypothetical protein
VKGRWPDHGLAKVTRIGKDLLLNLDAVLVRVFGRRRFRGSAHHIKGAGNGFAIGRIEKIPEQDTT